MLTIGIPRALHYYYNGILWETFVSELGFGVAVSEPTNRKIFETGLKVAYSELCLPVKVFLGHVASLSEKVDLLLIPRFIRVEPMERFTCPKFIGLPDLVKASFAHLPPVISVDVDLGKRSLSKVLDELGRTLGAKRKTIDLAKKVALARYSECQRQRSYPNEINTDVVRIGVAGHPYIIQDRFLSMNLVGELNRLGADTIIPDIREEVLNGLLGSVAEISWSYERRLVGEVAWLTQRADGAILVLSFGCGPGSVIAEIIQRELLDGVKYPLLVLILDENTSSTALITRLESFYDMVRMKKR